MARLKAGKKGVFGDHSVVYADPDDEFWVGKKGYVVDEEEEEVDLDSMTNDQLDQFIKDYDLDVPTTITPKKKKVKAIEEALAAVDEADDEEGAEEEVEDEASED